MMTTKGTSAHVELSFSPNVDLVPIVRRFVAQFYPQLLRDSDAVSRLALATHELLENAVKYSSDGGTHIRIDMDTSLTDPEYVSIKIATRNPAAANNRAIIAERFKELEAARDPLEYYQVLLRRAANRSEGSGLGLGRIRAEAEMTLTCAIEGDFVSVVARAECKARPKS
jgi:hypothetical protein